MRVVVQLDHERLSRQFSCVSFEGFSALPTAQESLKGRRLVDVDLGEGAQNSSRKNTT